MLMNDMTDFRSKGKKKVDAEAHKPSVCLVVPRSKTFGTWKKKVETETTTATVCLVVPWGKIFRKKEKGG